MADEPGPERSPSASAAQPRPTADAIDLLDTAGAPVLKRVLPVVAGLVALLLVWRLLAAPALTRPVFRRPDGARRAVQVERSCISQAWSRTCQAIRAAA